MHSIRSTVAGAGFAALASSCATPAPPVATADLVGSSWHVAGLNAGGVQTREMTIRFEEGGRVTGNAACNDYRVAYELQGRRLRFGKTVALMTDRTCDRDTEETEERFLATLGEVRHVAIAPSGSLVLYTGTDMRITARPVP